MKLIIEIPEEQYNDIVKYLTNNDGNYAYSDFNLREIVRNGTPYNPSGDAISREALKEVISKVVTEERKEDERWAAGLRYALTLIDNAPPVEPHRPQGEWINHRNDYGHNIADCSLCGKAMQWHDEDEDGVPRYCWYCGADMRAKENDNAEHRADT